MPPLPYPGRFEPLPLNFKIAIKYASFYGLVFHFLCSPIFSQQQHYSKTFTEAGSPVVAEGRADSIAHIFIPTSSLGPAPALAAAQYILTLHQPVNGCKV